MTIDEWREVFRLAENDFIKGEIFRNVLLKKLKEIYWYILSIKVAYIASDINVYVIVKWCKMIINHLSPFIINLMLYVFFYVH